MREKLVVMMTVLVIGMLLGACVPGAKTQDAMMDEKPTEAMMEKTATPEMMDAKEGSAETEEPDAMMEETATPEMMAPAWYAAEMTHAVSGEAFKIDDFKGQVVLVETFAQWCSTCLRQQQEIVKLHEMMGKPEDLVTVTIDIDPNEDAAMLKTYLEKHGFDWHYAVASPETAREIGSLYGDQFLNPPSAPMLIIGRNGEAHPLPFGVKSAEDLQKALEPFLSGGM